MNNVFKNTLEDINTNLAEGTYAQSVIDNIEQSTAYYSFTVNIINDYKVEFKNVTLDFIAMLTEEYIRKVIFTFNWYYVGVYDYLIFEDKYKFIVNKVTKSQVILTANYRQKSGYDDCANYYEHKPFVLDPKSYVVNTSSSKENPLKAKKVN